MNTYIGDEAAFAVDLVNSYDVTLVEPERLLDLPALNRFLIEHDIEVLRTLTEEDLEEVRRLRTCLRESFETEDDQKCVRILNRLLARAPVVPSLTTAEGNAWTLRLTVESSGRLHERLGAIAALGLSDVLQRFGTERMRICSASPCRDVFIDTSRNGSRRYCSDRCGNRANVAAFRSRRRKASKS